jgi:hypothetical protein
MDSWTHQGDFVNQDWLKDALCRGTDTRLFFAETGDIHTQRQAVTFCNGTLAEVVDPTTGLSATTGQPGCPVRLQCLDYALSFPQDQDNHGVYGGTLPSQRVTIRSAARKPLSVEETKRNLELKELLGLIHGVLAEELHRSETGRIKKYKARIERRQD